MNRLVLIMLLWSSQSFAFNWLDLWVNRDYQGKELMQKGQFSKAEHTFLNPSWKALAAFRSGNFQAAAQQYAQLDHSEYNLATALAHAGQLEQALAAYNRAIQRDPNDQDALYNRKIVEELLKQRQQNQSSKPNQQDKSQNKKNDSTQDHHQSKSPDSHKNKQDKEDKPNQQKQGQEQDQEQDLDKNPKRNPLKPKQNEQQHAQQQWLNLIPDDPGGLLREKFLRDYMRRQQGY